MKEYQNRAAVPKEYKMDLSEFFQSDEEFNEAYQSVSKKINSLKDYQGKLNDSKQLEKFLDVYFKYSNIVENLYVYAYISHDLELSNELYTEMKNRAESLYTQFHLNTSFFVPEIVGMDYEKYQGLWNNKNLEKYKYYLDEIYKEKEHTLSKEEEQLLETLTETYSSYENISSSLINSEHNYGMITVDGKRLNIAANNLRALKRNPLEVVRKTAHKKFSKVVKQYQDTESKLLYYYIKNNCILARVRKFDNAWAKKLHQIDLPNKVFENLKSVAKEHCGSWQHYYQLIKKVAGQKILHNYDTLMEWNASDKKEYSILEAEHLIMDALKVLGPTYQKKLSKVFDNHYIDYCSYKGKVSGGYSFATCTQNSRIVLSFNGTFGDVLTIAHESGHNVHHQYVNENNLNWYRHTSSFTAEIASLTNEFLVNHYISLHAKNKSEQLKSIEQILKTFQTNFFGAIMEAEMEQKMYEYVEQGNMLTSKYLNDLASNTLKGYQGNVIKNDEFANLLWVTRSHYFMNFYLYSYALCVSIAAGVALKIINQENGILEKYESFLKCGSNMPLKDIYQTLGIDINEKSVFEDAVQFFDEKILQYEDLLKRGEENE